MKYAVLSDTHFGGGRTQNEVYAITRKLRWSGYNLILAGDIFDTWRDKEAVDSFKHVLRPGDMYITGNHDFDANLDSEGVHTSSTYITINSGDKKFFITHGDCVDFMYAFALLEDIRKYGSDNLLHNLAARLKRWRAEDVYSFYDSMNAMPEWVVKALEHKNGWWFRRLAGLAASIVLVSASLRETQTTENIPSIAPTGGSVRTLWPRELAARIHAFFPASRDADYIIMGHLHKQIHSIVEGGDNPQELIALGAWVKGSEGTVALIENGSLDIKCSHEFLATSKK